MTVVTALLLLSCKKIVTLKLNNVPAAIVIQGNVTNGPGPYYVAISQPVSYTHLDVYKRQVSGKPGQDA